MKKCLILFLAYFAILFFAQSSFAVEPYNERWTCLEAKRSMSDTSVTAPAETEGRRWVRYVHSASVTTKSEVKDRPLSNADTYIVECLQIPTNLNIPAAVKAELTANGGKIPTEICTTGDSTVDKFIWNGNDRFALTQKIFSAYDTATVKGYEYDGYYKDDFKTKIIPESTDHFIKTDASGNFTTGKFIYVSDVWLGFEIGHKLMAYNRFPKNGDGLNVPGLGAQQQGKLEFDFATANKQCVKIAWDPYGTVFDTQTLEPVPGSTVALYIKQDGVLNFRLVNNDDMPGGFIVNPLVTKEDGYFSFVVPDGTYKLGVAATNYTFPTTLTTFHRNAQTIYSDFYRGEDIVQQGAIVHRDIPVSAPASTVTQKYPAKLIGLFQSVISDGNTIIDGHASHPFAKINAYCKTLDGAKGTLNTTLQADKRGQFQLTFKPKLCNENTGETYAIVEVEAIDLTKSLSVRNLFDKIFAWIIGKKDVEAAYMPISYSFDPILNYVEGYAMDSTNTSLPGATVGVYAIGDKQPLHTIKADSTGKFALTSDQLPKSPYELKYQNTLGALTSVTTSKFIAQNLPTIKKEKIDLYSEKLTPPPTPSPPKTSMQGSASSISSSVKSNPSLNRKPVGNSPFIASSKQPQSLDMQNNAVKNQIIIMVIIMILIVGVGGMIALFMLKKQSTPTSF